MSFKIAYAPNESAEFKSVSIKKSFFNSDWDEDDVLREIKEYIYDVLDNDGESFDEDSVVIKNESKTVKKIIDFFKNDSGY